jgi:hypothetical protein
LSPPLRTERIREQASAPVENDFPEPMFYVYGRAEAGRPHISGIVPLQQRRLNGGSEEETEMKLSGVLIATAALNSAKLRITRSCRLAGCQRCAEPLWF